MRVGTITLLRPLQSARNPQKWELTMIPIDVMPERTPLCCVVRCKSHSATGNTKLIPEKSRVKIQTQCFRLDVLPVVSNDVAVIIIPEMNMRI